MSKIQTHTFTCPYCGKTYEQEVYDTVNVKLNPELKNKVIDGSIFDVTCPHCNKITRSFHALVYNDMDKNFMVTFNCFGNLLYERNEFIESLNNKDNIATKLMSDAIKDVQCIGVDSIDDMISVINAFDLGLEYKSAVGLIGLIINNVNRYKREHNENNYEMLSGHLKNKRNEKGDYIFSVRVKKDDEYKSILYPFTEKEYEDYQRLVGKFLNKVDNYYITSREPNYYLNQSEEIEKESQDTIDIYFIQLNNGFVKACTSTKFIEEELKPNTLVLTELENGERNSGVLLKKVTYKKCEFPIDSVSLPKIVKTVDDLHMIVKSRDDEVNNEWYKDLLGMDETIENGITIDDNFAEYMNNSIFYIAYQKDAKFLFDEDCEIIVPNKTEAGVDTTIITSINKILINNEVYLCVYTDLDEIKDKSLDYITISFNEVARIIRNDSRYDGAIINPDVQEQAFILTNGAIRQYLFNKTVATNKNFQQFISKLTSKDIELLGQNRIDMIQDGLVDPIGKDFNKKYGFEKDEDATEALIECINTLNKCIAKYY